MLVSLFGLQGIGKLFNCRKKQKEMNKQGIYIRTYVLYNIIYKKSIGPIRHLMIYLLSENISEV